MASGVELFAADGSLMLSSQNLVALYHSSVYLPAGSDTTVPIPTGVSNTGVTAWPDNGHTPSSIFVGQWTEQLGPWKPIVSIAGGVAHVTFPPYKMHYFTTNQEVSYGPDTVVPHSGVALDFWAN